MKAHTKVGNRARIYFADGHVEYFDNQVFAFALWLALPKGIRAAFRGRGNTTPVYPWDHVDRLRGKES